MNLKIKIWKKLPIAKWKYLPTMEFFSGKPVFFKLSILALALGGIVIFLNGAALAGVSDGRIIYSNNSNDPQNRTYSGATNSFSAASAAVSIAGGQSWFVNRACPTRTEHMGGFLAGTTLYVIRWNGTTWSTEWSIVVGGGTNGRRFDIAYENTTGNAVVVYSNNTSGANELRYRIWNGSTWTAAANLNSARLTGTPNWIKLTARPSWGSNEIAATIADTNNDLTTMIWSGSAWGNEPATAHTTNLYRKTTTGDCDVFDHEYSSLNGDLFVVFSDGNDNNGQQWHRRYVQGTGWDANSTNWGTGIAGPLQMFAAADPLSDQILFGFNDGSSNNVYARVWTGSTMNAVATAATNASNGAANRKYIAGGWLTSGVYNTAVVVYRTGNSNRVDYAYTTTGMNFTQNLNSAVTAPQTKRWMDVAVDTGSGDRLMLTFSDGNNDLWAKRLVLSSGPTFTWTDADGGTALSSSLPGTAVQNFSFAYKPCVPTGSITIPDGQSVNGNPLDPTALYTATGVSAPQQWRVADVQSDLFNDGVVDPKWTLTYVGNDPAPSPNPRESGGTLSLDGRGYDIWDYNDQFSYLWQNGISGDFTIEVKVNSITNNNRWSKAGVMIRQSLDTNSMYAFTFMTPVQPSAGNNNGVSFQRRTATGAYPFDNHIPSVLLTTPKWVRVSRTGNTFTGYYSLDGITWTQIGTDTIVMTDPVYIGLAVTAHTSPNPPAGYPFCTANFDNFLFTPGPSTGVTGMSTSWAASTTPIDTTTGWVAGGVYTLLVYGVDGNCGTNVGPVINTFTWLGNTILTVADAPSGRPAAGQACPSAVNLKMDKFQMQVNTGTASVTQIVINAGASNTADVAANGVKIWTDNAGNLGTQVGSAASFSGQNATITIPGGETVGTSAQLYWITYDIVAAPTNGDALTSKVSSITTSPVRTVINTTTTSAAQTVDTAAPAQITDFTAVCGDAQAALAWTNPADTDLAEVKVLRKTGGYPTGPGDGGATQVYDNTSPLVGGMVNTNDTGLTNGSTYYWAVYSRDNCGNWRTTTTAGQNAASCTPRQILTVADGANRPAATVWCPSTAYVIDQFNLSASSGTITVTSITVQGSNSVTGSITNVKLYRDTNGNGALDGGEPQVGFTQIFAGVPPTVTFAGLSESINSTGTDYLIVYTVAAAPVNGAVVTSRVTGVTAPGANINNTATVSNSMTIRRYPSLITNFTATCGVTSSTLTWTNPSEANLAEVKVLRKTGGYPTGYNDAGATQVYDNTSPVPGGAVNCNDAGLTTGTLYFWAVYSKDACGNWNNTTTVGSNAASCTPAPFNALTVSNPAHPGGGNVAQASTNNIVDRLRFTATGGTITVTNVKIKQLGTATVADIASVILYTDTNQDGLLAGETFLGSGVFNSADSTYTISGLNLAVTSASQDILIIFNIASGAIVGRTIQSQVLNNTYITVAAPDTVSNNNLPITSNVFTIVAGGGSSGPGPTVLLFNPKDGGIVSGSFKLQVQVYWGSSALTSAGYSINGGGSYTDFNLSPQPAGNQNTNYSPGANSTIYEINLTLIPGAYTLKARGVSAAGTGTSRSITIIVRPDKADDPARAGDGNLLARDNSSQLCMDCHALRTHSSQYTGTQYGNWAVNCLDCHKPHEVTNIYLLNTTINTPNAGNQAVKFWNTTGDDGAGGSSYVHGNTGTDGICQSCHTQTKNPATSAPRWRSGSNTDNHYTQAAGTQRCTTCHTHTSGFAAP